MYRRISIKKSLTNYNHSVYWHGAEERRQWAAPHNWLVVVRIARVAEGHNWLVALDYKPVAEGRHTHPGDSLMAGMTSHLSIAFSTLKILQFTRLKYGALLKPTGFNVSCETDLTDSAKQRGWNSLSF